MNEAKEFPSGAYMTVRDIFAVRAMQAQLTFEGMEGCDKAHIAGMAYELADAMLAERSKKRDLPS